MKAKDHEASWLGPDYLDQFKEKYNATALAKTEKGIFDNIAMKQLNIGDIQLMLKDDLTVKHKNTVELPLSGTSSGNLHEAWAMINYLEFRAHHRQIRIYMADEIPDYYVICWGKFGNEDVYDFDYYFEIKQQYKGWKAGLKFSL
jgi:hypothetical protein